LKTTKKKQNQEEEIERERHDENNPSVGIIEVREVHNPIQHFGVLGFWGLQKR